MILNSSGGVLAEQAYKNGDLPFFAKFVSDTWQGNPWEIDLFGNHLKHE